MSGQYEKTDGRTLGLPARFRHPKTGVCVEVDYEGVVTSNGVFGSFREFSRMKTEHGFEAWTYTDEVSILRRHGWIRVAI